MKKIILAVILVAALGGAAYYLLQNKMQNAVSSFKQEQIIGKWTLVRWTPFGDSLARKDTVALFPGNPDSNRTKYDYDFKKENIVVISLNDSVLSDTVRYQWTKDNHIEWKKQNDSAESLAVTTLNKDSLVLQTKDSAVIYFKKAN